MQMTRREVLRAGVGVALASAAGGRRAAEGAARMQAGGRMLSAAEIAQIDRALGTTGRRVDAESVYTVALPRRDLHVTIAGRPAPTPFGFGGWASFKHTRDGRGTMLMSDTVLLQEEVNPVVSAAQANRIEVTALHNHFFWEEPRIFFMHLHAMGTPEDLARRYAAALAPSKLLPAHQPPAGPASETAPFDRAALDRIVGATGTTSGGVYKYTVGRPGLTVVAMDTAITTAMGLNSWAALAGRMQEAQVAGDMAMREAEVNPVIAALRAHGLNVVAVHNHMLGEKPRIIFLHYYGTGPATQLVTGFRAALDRLRRG